MRTSYKMRNVNKKHTQKYHFKKRFKQRVGTECTKIIYNEIINSIKNSRGVFLYRDSNRIACFLEIIGDKQYIIVYDIMRESLVTLISEEDFSDNQKYIISNLSGRQLKKFEQKEKINV